MKIAIGAIVQESNTFSPHKSTMDYFRNNIYYLGEDMLSLQVENEVSGGIQAAKEQHAEVIPTLCLYAVSAGMFERSSFDELRELLTTQMQAAKDCDGVYFALHGAMVAEHCDDADGCIIDDIRRMIGNIPFVVSLDLHANVTRKMKAGCDAIVGYRTFPHTDFFSTGVRSVRLLCSMVRKECNPKTAMRKIPMIVPAENGQTTRGPLFELWKEAEKGEACGNSMVTSLFPVQPWLDIEEMGCSVVVVSDRVDQAEREADRLAQLFWDKRHDFDITLHKLADVIRLAESLEGKEGPVVISDSADSPGAGSSGDSTAVLKEMLERNVQDRLECLVTVTDALAVHKSIAVGVGQEVELAVGYTLTGLGEPCHIRGKVRRIGDGRFFLNGGHAKGTLANMGKCVVIEIGRLSLLIGEYPVFSGDPSMYRTMGLEPARADLVLVKSANQFRADYESISKHIYILDTPGPSSANIKKLLFTKLPNPFYPFQDHFDWRQYT